MEEKNRKSYPSDLTDNQWEEIAPLCSRQIASNFCHPYSAYERGSNENMNRIVRRFFPKGTNFDNVTVAEVQRAQDWLNHYPRKILGWQSPDTFFRRALAAV